MRRLVLLLLSLQLLAIGIVPRGDVQELIRASTVWEQHRAAKHADEGFLAFLYDHFVAHTHDDPTGAHRALALHPGHTAAWAVVAPVFRIPTWNTEALEEEAPVLRCGHPVQPARQGMGTMCWRPPQGGAQA